MSRGGKWLCIHLPCSSWGCGANALPALRLHFLKVHRSNESSSTALVLSALWASLGFLSFLTACNTQTTTTNLINNSCYSALKHLSFYLFSHSFPHHPEAFRTPLLWVRNGSLLGSTWRYYGGGKQEGGIDWGFSRPWRAFKTFHQFFQNFSHTFPSSLSSVDKDG